MEEKGVGQTVFDEAHSFLELTGVGKDYTRKNATFSALKDVTLSFPEKGIVAILGESGSGKTTLLNLIGGLDAPTRGSIRIEGREITGLSSRGLDHYRNREIGFVFQSYHLIGHQTVLQNVLLPLKLAGVKQKEATRIAKEKLALVGLAGQENKRPSELSGGQAQRAAIARAIANSPKIILADEPTGALDSETSVQIMDQLADIAASRLVLLVTHNQALANRYASRILVLKDGEVVSDTGPEPEKRLYAPSISRKKPRMSLLSAIASSLMSLRAKIGRSAITAFACSVGIVGVGLVAATTTGFSSYVGSVEAGIASAVPISIAPNIYSVNTKSVTAPSAEAFPDDDQVHVYNTNANLYVSHKNQFTPEYVEYLSRIMDDPGCPVYGDAMSVLFNRANLDFHFLTQDGQNGDHIRRISQYTWAGETAYSINSYTQLPTYIMHELYGDEDKLSSLYDVIYGRFPTAANEMVLIVDRYNRVEFSTLQRTGILPSNIQYADLVNQGAESIDFSSIVADDEDDEDCKVYRCYKNSDYFRVGKVEPNVISRDTYDDIHFDPILKKFVGTESTKTFTSYINADLSGVDYPYDLVYEDESFNPIECKIVGVIRPTKQSFLQLMPASIGYTPALTAIMAGDYAEGAPGHVLAEQERQNWYVPRLYAADGVTKSSADGLEILNASLAPLIEDLQTKSFEEITSMLTSTYITNLLNGVIRYVGASCTMRPNGLKNDPGITTSISTYLSWCHVFGTEFDTSDVPPMSAREESVIDWLRVFLSRDLFAEEGSPNIVECLSYMNAYSVITNILVFPSSLTTKDALKGYLDAWNVGKTDAEAITYADVMSDVTSGLGAIVSVVSGVLVVFASISLIVSSLMTAIITYIRVVERTQEIGVLRACGASKGNVAEIFESETAVVGIVAGLIGIGATYLLCQPINLLLKREFSAYVFTDIAWLSPWFALGMLGVSVLLALLSGLIPALLAARKDPVVCLRSDE